MKSLLLLVLPLFFFSATALAQTYEGDQVCGTCHANNPSQGFFDGYMNSGHPWKIFRTEGQTPAPDAWPHTPVPPLPSANNMQLDWSDVEYVIGNFYWKTRFIDRQGFIWTGDIDDTTQWNVLKEEWVPYHPGEQRPFNCGQCHTTGYEPTGNQHGLTGLVGTWAQDGVRCEACHGPSSDHVASFGDVSPPGGKDCADCHFRDAGFRMPWSGGFMRHHQQSEDFSHSPHSVMLDCNTCHNPHRSVVYNDGGTIKECVDCHSGDQANGFYRVAGMANVDCIDCHMPFTGKSGQSFNTYTGDIRGHLFAIMTDPTAAADNTYEDGGSTFWNQDLDGNAFVTLDYACLGCHEDVGDGLTLQDASLYAAGIHNNHPVPIVLSGFQAQRDGLSVQLRWRMNGTADFRVYRETWNGDRVEVTNQPVNGDEQFAFTDRSAPSEALTYWLQAIETESTTWYGPFDVDETNALTNVALAPAWPNPFSGEMSIQYSLPAMEKVMVSVFDLRGRRVAVLENRVRAPGEYVATWDGRTNDGSRAAHGQYLIRLDAGSKSRSQKVTLGN